MRSVCVVNFLVFCNTPQPSSQMVMIGPAPCKTDCLLHLLGAFGNTHLDDFLLGAWQLDVAPVKALTLGGGTPHAVRPPRAPLLMHCNHAGPHKEDAHIHIRACVCSQQQPVLQHPSGQICTDVV